MSTLTRCNPVPALLSLLVLGCLGLTAMAAAGEPCTGFKWDVRKEQALFAGASEILPAGKNAAFAPRIVVDRLYQVQLLPQSQVSFALEPGAKMVPNGTYAGLAALDLDAPGYYRVAVDVPLWIDVVANGKAAAVNDYQGQRGCEAPHKIVEFELSGAKHFVVQLSASGGAIVRLTVTKTPAGRPELTGTP